MQMGSVGELHTACPGSALVLRWALSLAARLPQFSVIIQPLFESFRGTVSGSNLEELHRSALCWLEQCCSLPVLRPSECGRPGASLGRGPVSQKPGSMAVSTHTPEQLCLTPATHTPAWL